MRVEADADCLAALMVLDPSLEPTPEPFRMQPDVTVVINLTEYIRFVQSLPSGSRYLRAPTDTIQSAIAANDTTRLLKSFYLDMALAEGKELYFAEREHRGATRIRHTLDTDTPYKNVRVSEKAEIALRRVLKDKGFELPTPISAMNKTHWDYACKLAQDVLDGPTKWVEK